MPLDNATKSAVQSIPLLSVRAGPRDGDQWIARLKQELNALIAYVNNNKKNDTDWFIVEPNKLGTKSAPARREGRERLRESCSGCVSERDVNGQWLIPLAFLFLPPCCVAVFFLLVVVLLQMAREMLVYSRDGEIRIRFRV